MGHAANSGLADQLARGWLWIVTLLAALPFFAVIALAACDRSPQESAVGSGDSEGVLFALLADNRLMKVSTESGTVLAERRLGPPPRTPATGRYLGVDRHARTLFALVPGQQAASVLVVDIPSMGVRARYPLPGGIDFRGLVVGPVSGRLYAVGNRAGPKLVDDEFDIHERNVVVVVLDPLGGEQVARAIVRHADEHDWLVYRVVISDDERTLYVSYHGLDTSGADAVAVADETLTGCHVSAREHLGCFPRVHGSVEPVGDKVVASTGSPVVIEIGRSGAVERSWTTGLESDHLMELALTPDRSGIYALGSCAQAGGLSAIGLEDDRTSDVVPPGSELFVCGERLAAGAHSMAFVGQTDGASLVGVGSILFVDVDSKRVVRRIAAPFAAADLVAITSAG